MRDEQRSPPGCIGGQNDAIISGRALTRAIGGAQTALAGVIEKPRYWEKLRDLPLNKRQRLVIHRVLEGFEGKLTTALFEPVLSAVLRIATHPAIFKPPSPCDAVEAFIDTCLVAPAAKGVRAEAAHWALFRDLCTKADCRGSLIQDAYLAAIALEHDCTYVTTDGDYAGFPGLRWRHPIDST